jgi:hypothetical protein
LHQAVYGPEWQAQVAGGLTAVAAAVLIALLVRGATRHPAAVEL